MDEGQKKENKELIPPMDISDDDVYEAMKKIEGYLDITPGDFKLLYGLAYSHAISRLTKSVKAIDIMTREVFFVSEGTPLKEVAEMMTGQGISGLPVVDAERMVVGVISEKDFVFHMGGEKIRSFMGVVAHCLKNKGCIALPMRHQKAKDIMTSPAITVREATPVIDVTNILAENNINRVPVVDDEEKLVGIVARADIVQTSCTVIIPPRL